MSNQPICFVITGFGIKTDYQTGKSYNLDLSFKELIKPVFDALGFWCLRTIELDYTGSIERKMYEFILKADFVIADLSTLNPNALYELGVRHALKPYTTIMIAESSLFGDTANNIPSRLPFDLNHYVILPYVHLGTKIDPDSKKSFQEKLERLVLTLKDKKDQDSPVFDNLNYKSEFTNEEVVALQEEMKNGENLQSILEAAEKLKNQNQLEEALLAFKKAKDILGNYVHDDSEYITQRIALCTYKRKPNDLAALQEAWDVLQTLNPEKSTNTETLGLAGAIQKRLFEITSDITHAELAHKLYNKGFYINDDYYTGINAAYMQNVLAKNNPDMPFYNDLANHTRTEVLHIIDNIIKAGEFYKRNDVQWILQTKAEAEFMLGKTDEFERTMIKLEDMDVAFDKSSFDEQMKKLKQNFKN